MVDRTENEPSTAARQPRGVRARHRAAVEADILQAARTHLATDGAAALSLRAVARDLGMVSSALYRYVANRDELLTRLIVAAYTSLADQASAAHDAVASTDLDGRWRAIAGALRAWALEHPHEYALLYGSPVPDYNAPAERTTEPGTRVFALVAGLLADARAAGALAPGEGLDQLAAAGAGSLVDDAFVSGAGLDAGQLMAGLAAWSLVMGTLSAEVFGQLGADTIDDPEAYFEHHVELARRLVLRS